MSAADESVAADDVGSGGSDYSVGASESDVVLYVEGVVCLVCADETDVGVVVSDSSVEYSLADYGAKWYEGSVKEG